MVDKSKVKESCKSQLSFIITTVVQEDFMYKTPVSLTHTLNFEVGDTTTTMQDSIVFDDTNYGSGGCLRRHFIKI